MSVLINIALLTLGFVGTLAAFGGETWRRGDEPLLMRVTRRGWLSLACLLLALALGVAKEIRALGEKSGLEQEIASLHDQIRRQRVLLAAKRLDELREQGHAIDNVGRQIAVVRDVYERFRSAVVNIEGRAQAKGAAKPYELDFSYASSDFRFDVCDESFEKATGREFDREACLHANFPATVDLIPTEAYERSQFGLSVISMMTFLSAISIAERDAVNGPHGVAESDKAELSVVDVLESAFKLCGVPSDVAAKQTERAKVIRAVEEAAQQLNWLFKFGYAAPPDNSDQAAWLEGQRAGASAELLVQMANLDEMTRVSAADDKEIAFRLGAFIDAVALGYQQLTKDIARSADACETKREGMRAEERVIADGQNLLSDIRD